MSRVSAPASARSFSSASRASPSLSGRLYVVSGPSGAGKGTLLARLLALRPDLWESVSATTRAPRPGEQDGVAYFFTTKEAFEDEIARDGFIEYADVHGNYYGTPLAPIREHMAAGTDVVLEIDVQGAFQVREKVPEARLVFITPPSAEELERRLRGRGTDSPEAIATRLENARAEMAAARDYDVVVVNDELDRATEELLAVLES